MEASRTADPDGWDSDDVPAAVENESSGKYAYRYQKFEPIWFQDFSYRGNPYRFLDHQNNIMGRLKIRLISCRCLFKMDRGYLGNLVQGSLRPYITFSVEGVPPDEEAEACSSSAPQTGGTEFHWGPREALSLPVPKGAFFGGGGDGPAPPSAAAAAAGQRRRRWRQRLLVEVHQTEGLARALLVPRRVKGRGRLAAGAAPLGPLLRGDLAVLEAKVPLAGGRGEVHLTVEYAPHGVDPRVGDVVALEGFARPPPLLWGGGGPGAAAAAGGSLLPRGGAAPLRVLAAAGCWLLLETAPGEEGGPAGPAGLAAGRRSRLRVHRNAVFVVERLTYLDGIYNLLLKPTDALQKTKRGRWILRKTAPLASRTNQMLGPVYAGAAVLAGTTKIVLRTTVGGVLAAIKGAWGGAINSEKVD